MYNGLPEASGASDNNKEVVQFDYVDFGASCNFPVSFFAQTKKGSAPNNGAEYCALSGVLLRQAKASIDMAKYSVNGKLYHNAFTDRIINNIKESSIVTVHIWISAESDFVCVQLFCNTNAYKPVFMKKMFTASYQQWAHMLYECVRVFEGNCCCPHLHTYKYTIYGGNRFCVLNKLVIEYCDGMYVLRARDAKCKNQNVPFTPSGIYVQPMVICPADENNYYLVAAYPGHLKVNLTPRNTVREVASASERSTKVVFVEPGHTTDAVRQLFICSEEKGVVVTAGLNTSSKLSSTVRDVELPTELFKHNALHYSFISPSEVADYHIKAKLDGKKVFYNNSSSRGVSHSVTDVIRRLSAVDEYCNTSITKDCWPIAAARYSCLQRVIYVDGDDAYCCGMFFKLSQLPYSPGIHGIDSTLLMGEFYRWLAVTQLTMTKFNNDEMLGLPIYFVMTVIQDVNIRMGIMSIMCEFRKRAACKDIALPIPMLIKMEEFSFIDPDYVGLGNVARSLLPHRKEEIEYLWAQCVRMIDPNKSIDIIGVSKNVRINGRKIGLSNHLYVFQGCKFLKSIDVDYAGTGHYYPQLKPGKSIQLVDSVLQYLNVLEGGIEISSTLRGDLVERSVKVPQLGNQVGVFIDPMLAGPLSSFGYMHCLESNKEFVDLSKIKVCEFGKERIFIPEKIKDSVLEISPSFFRFYLSRFVPLISFKVLVQDIKDYLLRYSPHYSNIEQGSDTKSIHGCVDGCNCVNINHPHKNKIKDFVDIYHHHPDRYQLCFFSNTPDYRETHISIPIIN